MSGGLQMLLAGGVNVSISVSPPDTTTFSAVSHSNTSPFTVSVTPNTLSPTSIVWSVESIVGGTASVTGGQGTATASITATASPDSVSCVVRCNATILGTVYTATATKTHNFTGGP